MMRKQRYEILALILLVVVIVIISGLTHRDDFDVLQGVLPSEVVRSSYRSFPEGYKALYLTMRELGFTVHRQTRPYAMLPERGLLIVADTHQTPVSDYEARRLLEWVKSGNHAVFCIEHHPEEILLGFLEGMPEEERIEALAVDWRIYRKGGMPVPFPMGYTASSADVARPIVPSFLADAAPRLHTEATYSFSKTQPLPPAIAERVGGVVPLYADSAGAAVTYSPVGDGGIFWCNSPWSFSNEGLKAPGNFEFVLALANLQPDAPVIFDEYHHGYGAGINVWTLAPNLLKLGAVQFAVALILLLVTIGWRFGVSRLPAEERFTRSRAEYLTSMAGLLERAGATHVVRERLQNMVKREVGRRLGVSQYAPPERFLDANARHPVVDQPMLQRVFHQLDTMSQQRRPAPEAVLRLSGDIHRMLNKKCS